MLILEKGRDTPVEVYGLYWCDGERVFWVVPYKGYEGLVTVAEKDCELIDARLSDSFVLRKNDADEDFLLHCALDENDLIYDVLEHDPVAMQEFMRRLSERKSEGGKE